MFKIIYCSTTDGMGEDITCFLSAYDLHNSVIYFHNDSVIDIVHNILDYIGINYAQLISVTVVDREEEE